LIGFFVDFTMSYTGKSSGTGEPFPEPANAGEQVNISYGFLSHTPFLEKLQKLTHNQRTSPLSHGEMKYI
jgi:hypothetical protein